MKRIEAFAQQFEMVACKAISNGALASEKLPTRIKLLNWGRNATTKGDVIFDDHSVAQLAANQRDAGFDRVALDYEHNTVPESDEFKRTREPRDVAAYGVPEAVPGDGLYLGSITWTPSGRVNARNFADLSPTPFLDKARRVVFLHSVALVRNGAVHDLSFFSAAAGTPRSNDNTAPNMTPEQIAALLKPITDQLATLSADLKTLKETKPAEPVITLTAADGKTTTMPLAEAGAKIVALTADVTALKTADEAKQKAEVIALFAREGKVPLGEDGKAMKAEALTALPVGVLKMLLASTPATVPQSARAKAGASTETGNQASSFGAAVLTLSAEKKITKSAAMDLVIAEQPELYAAWRAANGPKF